MQGFAVKADQGIIGEAEGIVASTIAKFGKLDILVNNAAVFVTGAVGAEVDPEGFAASRTGSISTELSLRRGLLQRFFPITAASSP